MSEFFRKVALPKGNFWKASCKNLGEDIHPEIIAIFLDIFGDFREEKNTFFNVFTQIFIFLAFTGSNACTRWGRRRVLKIF
jgi:hypothetical protein